MRPLLIDGMHGLGDNLYQRAVLKAYRPDRELYLVTSWPQMYADLEHVRPVRHPNVRLRTQARNAAQCPPAAWRTPPAGLERLRWHYVHHGGTILESLCDGLGIRPDALDMDGPPTEAPPVTEPYVVVRPATVRTEWRADSRNPRPEYLAQAAEAARRAGYKVVSVADLEAGQEWALDPLPRADVVFHRGELRLPALLALIAGAAAVIGGVGWAVPAALAYRRPMLLIYGGWGAHNGPARIFDRRVDTSLIEQVVPDNFCMCGTAQHDCDKHVTDVGGKIENFFARLSRG